MKRAIRKEPRERRPLIIALLSLAGAAISAYLWSYKAGVTGLVCGPFGGCTTVNASPYSEVLGVPVAAIGTFVYLAILGLSAAAYAKPGRTAILFTGFSLSLAGALFSLYLTALEALIIHAYCVWCLASWAVITLVAVLWARSLRAASRRSAAGGARGRRGDS